MASTYSALKIELIGTGDQSGTWGVTTNNNLGTAIEEAITGRAIADFTSDTDLTLGYNDSNASQTFRNLILNVTSSVSLSTTRNLIVPTIEKQYLVENNTLGGQSIVVKTSAGSGVTVPNGRKVHVYADGANVVFAFDQVDTLNANTVNATNINTTTLDLTNLEVTNIKAKDGTASASIADSTGIFTHATATVFPAGTVSAPSITTTGDPNTGIYFPAADTIAFTEGGVEAMRIDSSGNVLVGTTTAQDRLFVYGTSSQYIRVGSATNNAFRGYAMGASNSDATQYGSIAMNIDSGELRILSGNNTYGGFQTFFTNGSERMRITSSGNVGIGTSSPTDRLSVGTLGTGSNNILIASSTTGTGSLYFGDGTGADRYRGYIEYVHTSDYMAFGTVATERMRLDSAGNLGLGVTPSAWFSGTKAIEIGATTALMDISGQTNLYQNAYLNSAGNLIYKANGFANQYRMLSGEHQFFITTSGTAGNAITFTQAMTLNASGNLGVGVTNPDAYLCIANSAIISGVSGVHPSYSTERNIFHGYYNGSGAGPYNRFLDVGAVGDGTWGGIVRFLTNANGSATPTERARITSGGSLLVGATAAQLDGASKVVVLNSSGTVAEFTGSEVSASQVIGRFWNTATSGDNKFQTFHVDAGATERGSIDFNRGATQVRYNTTSDATLKNIIGDSNGQRSLEILNTTRIREYTWKHDETQKTQVGVIAQELYETYKGAVSVGGEVEKTDEEGNVTTEYRPWAVDKTAFTFHLIAGWQEHQKLIQELKAELDTVKAELNTLKGA
jgi:hypothetical protein